MLLTPSPCHKLSHFLGPPPRLERDVLYGRYLASIQSDAAAILQLANVCDCYDRTPLSKYLM